MNYRKSLCVLLGLEEEEKKGERRKADRQAGDEDEDFYESISMFYDYAPSRFVLCCLSSAPLLCTPDCAGFT